MFLDQYGAFFLFCSNIQHKSVCHIYPPRFKGTLSSKQYKTMSKVPSPPPTYLLRLQTDLINEAGVQISKSQNFTLLTCITLSRLSKRDSNKWIK